MISWKTLATAFAVSIFCCLDAAPASAQQSSPTLEERLERLEKLLAETRAELAAAKAAPSADAARLSEIERRIEILAKEIEQLKLGEAAAAAPTAAGGAYGVGPAAAKVYSGKTGVSLGGYGEALYQNFARKDQGGAPSGKDDQVTLLRAVVYLGYKFDDHFLLNTELEYANAVVASDKKGEAEVEFAYIDYRHSRAFNARAGLVLIPMGLVNPLHEPTSFLGALRPDVEDRIIPSTWRELGLGVYGEAGLDYTGAPGLAAGASIFSGRAGQGRVTPSGRPIGASTTVWDAHADWRWRGLWLRGLYARSHVADAALINEHNGFVGNESVGSRQEGWYSQAAFDVLSLKAGSRSSLFPFLRYEKYDTQAAVPVGYGRNPENDASVLTMGLGFKPIEQLIVKTDWQRRRNAARTGVNQWNVALGYIF